VTARRRACRGLICRKAASGLAGDDVSDTPLATQPKTEDAMEITTQTHLAALRDLLVYRQRELRAEIHAAALEAVDKGLRADALEPVLDIKDSAMQQSSVDVMSAQARRDAGELAQVEAALLRLDSGTYGDCAACGEPIPLARLWVQPAATRCAHCQAETEKTSRVA
jgi:DnaK suppressor protein